MRTLGKHSVAKNLSAPAFSHRSRREIAWETSISPPQALPAETLPLQPPPATAAHPPSAASAQIAPRPALSVREMPRPRNGSQGPAAASRTEAENRYIGPQ